MSEWTIDTLKELFDREFTSRDANIKLALAELERRLALLNEFRAQQSDESRKYAQTAVVSVSIDALSGRISRTEQALSILQGRALALAGIGALFGGGIGALIVKFIG